MRRRGVVLVAVLILVALGAMVAGGLLFRMRAAVAGSIAVSDGEQAYESAISGIQRVLTVLQTSPEDMDSWYDNPDLFRGQFVCDDGTSRWYFTIYAPNPADEDAVRYGPIDEGGKINLNMAVLQGHRDLLLSLPNMNDQLVDCLMDYGDRDDSTRSQGAEQDYYDGLDHPYLIKNGTIATLEELLLVKGFSASIVFGEDYNLNGRLDVNENDQEETFPPDDSDGLLDKGLRDAVTTLSYGPDVNSDGNKRVDINQTTNGLEDLDLPSDTIPFIKLYIAAGNRFTHPADLLDMQYQLTRNQTIGGTSYSAGDVVRSGIGSAELSIVCHNMTARSSNMVMGLINANTASADVLTALDGISQSAAREIVASRNSLDSETKTTIAWLYTKSLLGSDDFKTVAPLLSARSYQYRVQVVGFGVPCGRFRVIEAVIDLAGQTPRVIYLRDITRLGLPCEIDVENLEASPQ